MMKLTKERLTEIVRAIDSEAYDEAEIMGWFNSDDIIAMARQLLVGMEQEPVYQVQHGEHWRDLNKAQYNDHVNLGAEGLRILYAAPQLPQPAVMDENGLLPCPFCGGKPEEDAGGCSEYDGHEYQDYSINCKSCGAEVYCAVGSFERADIPCSCHHNTRAVCVGKWNSRAAMLQGTRRDLSYPVDPQVAEYEKIMERAMPDEWVAVPVDMAPEQMRAVQLNSELGAYAAANLTGAYSLFREFWDVAIAAAPDFREISNSSTEHFRGNAETSTKCWCHTCRPLTMSDIRFVVCPECGNKRCPHANDHRNACTGSNAPGQQGSEYPAAPRQEADNG